MAIPRPEPDSRIERASLQASRLSRLARRALGLLLAAASTWLVTCVWRSRDWPVINDASLFHYVALRISQGAVPYREIFDFQFPGTLLVHLAVIETLGPGDAAWRVFDLALLAVSIAVIWAFLRPFGKVAAWAGAVLYTTWHLGLGAWNTGQRDFVMGPLLLGSALVIARAIESGAVARRLLLAGLCAGAAATIKPHAIVFALMLMPFVLAAGGRQRARKRVRALATFLAGYLIAPLGTGAWLVASGGALAFVEIVREYLLVLHLGWERMPLATLLHDWLTNRFVLPIYAAGVLGFWIGHSRGERGPRRLLLVTGFAYGIFHFAIQQKGWVYHFYPAALFGCAWLASALSIFEPLPEDRGEFPRPLSATARFLAALAVVLLAARSFTVLASRVEGKLGNTQSTLHIQNAVAQLEGEIASLAPAGSKVQVLDTGLIGIETLLHLRIAQPTRHTYAHPLYVPDTGGYTARLRAEFLADLERDPPRLFVVFGFHPETGSNDLLERFPELRAYLDAQWQVAVVHTEYRIFVPARG